MADPLVSLANRDATEAKESIHTHYDEDITIVDNSPSLVGRTDEARSDVSHRADRRNRAAAFVPRMIYGLDPSNSAGDLTADIAIAAGIAIDSTNTPTLVLPKSLIKRIEVRGAYRAPLRYWLFLRLAGT